MRRHALSAAFAASTAFSCGGSEPLPPVPVPPQLTPPIGPECAVYEGVVRGNDEMTATFALCQSANGISGWVRFVSEQSGWSDRAIEGGVDLNGRMILKDTGLIAAAPMVGWEFCPVEHYELVQLDAGRIEGHYRSLGCNDSANMLLRRVK